MLCIQLLLCHITMFIYVITKDDRVSHESLRVLFSYEFRSEEFRSES